MNQLFIEKMISAKQTEMEAWMTLVPDKMKGHVEVIGNELKNLVIDMCMDQLMSRETKPTPEQDQGTKSVKKVDIH